ncbi:MAG TPA: BREX-2 system adenine-specific DNA-methyltransferase PglX, partial [Myxococcales bacterium]|nr:BREX-2 system adenine-specific DNA-methyltransferase PglX [Myxococcales bacterium]
MSPRETKKKAKERDLTAELSRLLSKTLLPDLRERAKLPSVEAALRTRFDHEKASARTAEKLDEWIARTLEQVGAAWILSCVFVRTLEDRGLLDQRRIAGPGSGDSLQLFFELSPSLTERDYLLAIFREVAKLPGAEDLLGPRHNLAWRIGPSAEAARALLDFFREPKDDGSLQWTFEAPAGENVAGSNTRFLGDLYQDLSESVRQRYALLQTPHFVESFILDLTLEPAVKEFGLEELRLIDPTCGSGHFLLGAFDRLFEHRMRARPGLEPREHALAALRQVYGVDLNPYAVAIARFRLTLAFLEKSGIGKLREAGRIDTNLVVADSLLHGARGVTKQLSDMASDKASWEDELFALDDEAAARRVLGQGYHVVVGNPPYITCKDAALREKYRKLYPQSAAGKYALAAPFTECFFDLGLQGAGHVGLINANSFMKREFGKKLIESALAHRDLTHVIDTAGAFIPGHGTPTVILVGRNRAPEKKTVRAALGRRGEPETPADPTKGKVWLSIAEHLDEPGFENEFVSIADLERNQFEAHPWSLGGGGAGELKAFLEEVVSKRLGGVAESIGITCFTLEDDVFLRPPEAFARRRVAPDHLRWMVEGEFVRDWAQTRGCQAVFPYRSDFAPDCSDTGVLRVLWPYRSCLSANVLFGRKTKVEAGLEWFEYGRLTSDKLKSRLSIVLAFVATHNHFVLDRGGKVFNRSAPIIKLPEGATEDEHLALLGYLNSSVACFWMKQVMHKKSSASQKHHTDPARAAYEFAGTALKALPVPDLSTIPTQVVRRLLELGEKRSAWLSGSELKQLADAVFDADSLERMIEEGWRQCDEARDEALYLQEELDWKMYEAFGLIGKGQACVNWTVQRASPGARPFEHVSGYVDGVSARASKAAGVVQSVPRPDHWTNRIALLEDQWLRQVEAREYKRQWRDTEQNIDQQQFRKDAERSWLRQVVVEEIERLSQQSATVVSVRELVGRLLSHSRASTFEAIAEHLGSSLDTMALELVAADSVPFLAALRFAAEGIEKHAKWERTWDLQRREDAGEQVGEIPVPPKYDTKDYRDPVFWRLRGKLDLPKERFISYP